MSGKIRYLICSVCICAVAGGAFQGCSYRDMENAAKAKVAEIIPGEEEKAGTGNAQTESGQTNEADHPVYQIGDTVVWSSLSGQTVEHTVVEMRTAEKLEELGVVRDDCIPLAQSWYIGEDGEALGGPMAIEGEHYLYLELRIRVKNNDFDGWEPEDGGDGQIAIETTVYTQEEHEDPDAANMDKECIYFDGHQNDENRYFFCYLDPGEETEAVVIWVIAESDMAEPLYYVIGSATGRQTYQYILLNP